MMVGLFEPEAAAWKVDGIPRDFSFGEITPDWDRMGPFVERAISRVPVVETVGIRTFFCGPESFTPDLAPAVGEAPGIHGYFVCAGLNSVGILSAGGLGRVVAQWMTDGRPDVDVTGFDVARFRDWQLNPRHRGERTAEILGTVYAAHTPGIELASARGEFRSPVHDRLVAEGARLRDVSGWESAAWYAGRGQVAAGRAGLGRTSRGSTNWAAEHRAVREAVGLMDMSFMAKFAVRGRRRRRGARPAQRRCGQRPRRRHHLHPVARRGRRHPGRPHRDPAGARRLPRRRVRHRARAGARPAPAGGGGCRGDRRRRHHRPRAAHRAGPARRATPWPRRHRRSTGPRRPSRSGRPGGSPSPGSTCSPSGSPTSASSAGSCTRPPTARWRCGTPCSRRVRRTASGRPGCARCRACGWRRATATTATTSTTPTTSTRSGSASRWRSTSRVASPGGRRRWRPRSAARPHHRLVQVLLEDPEPLLFHAEPVLRDGVVVGYVRAASYGWTLGGAVGPGLRRWRRAGHARVARRGVVGGRRRRHAPSRPGSRCGRCTTRPAPG